MSVRSLTCWCLSMGVLTALAGCGGAQGPVPVPAKGVVTYKGQPMPKLSVAFIPDKGMLASGTTDDKGQFTLTTSKPGDGALVGTYKVAISHVSDEIPPMQGLSGQEKPPESPIPLKYGDPATSGITTTVDKDPAKNNFTFDLID